MSKTFSQRGKQTRKTPWFNPDTGFKKVYDDTQEYRGCARKQRKQGAYGHEKEALAAAAKIPRRTDETLSAYKCSYCKKYHLTSRKQTQ